MATIQSSLVLRDAMTPVLRNTVRALNSTLTAMKSIKNVQLGATFAQATRDIQAANNALNNFENSLNKTEVSTSRLKTGLAAMLSGGVLMKLGQLSDSLVSSTAVLNLTLEKFGETDLQGTTDKIYAMAQETWTDYTTQMQQISKMGILTEGAFKSSDELIKFNELLNKSFAGVGSTREQSAAIYQLIQALGANRLQGDELRAIREQAVIFAQAISKYTKEVMHLEGNIVDIASEGLITTEVIKSALAYSAEDIEKNWEGLSMTFGRAFTILKNSAVKAFEPISRGLGWILTKMSVVLDFIASNYGLLYAIAGILGIITAQSIILLVKWILLKIMNPFTWVLVGLMALVGGYFLIIGLANKFFDTNISGIGALLGVIYMAVAVIYNVIAAMIDFIIRAVGLLINPFVAIANFLANIFVDPIGSIIHLFADMGDFVLSILETLASAIDKIFGSSLADTISGWRSNLQGWADTTASKYGNGKYAKVIQEWTADASSIGVGRVAYSDAYNQGYKVGLKLEKSLGASANGLKNILDSMEDLTMSTADGSALKVANTGRLLTDEDIKLLLDVATRDYKLSYQQVTPNIQVSFGDVRETADVDGIMHVISERVAEVIDGRLVVAYD